MRKVELRECGGVASCGEQRGARLAASTGTAGGGGEDWPLHDIAITNIVWCIYSIHTWGRVSGVYCAVVVQYYYNSVGIAGRNANERMIGAFTEALK